MPLILEKKQLSADVFRLRVQAPLIAEERKAGQFIILQVNDGFGERIPLTIADADPVEGSITLIFQRVGKTTRLLSELNEGDNIATLWVRLESQPMSKKSDMWSLWVAVSGLLRPTRSRKR